MVAPLKFLTSHWRWWVLSGLALLVTAAHLGIVALVGQSVPSLPWNADGRPQRAQLVFLSEMPYAPPQATPRPKRSKPREKRPPHAVAALTQAEAAQAPASEGLAAPVTPAVPQPVAPVEAAASDSQQTAGVDMPSKEDPPFEWPASTRLHYDLTGYYQGEVRGQAQVEWVREGDRYQVHLEVEIGPSFAPIATRRMSSHGELTPEGLRPRYYEQATRLGFSGPYRAEVRFEPERVLLANGLLLPRPPGVQDTVSQFVQMSWLFDSQPDRVRLGQTIEVPLALPRRVSVWVYDIVGEEALQTPFGEVPTIHLKPRTVPGTTGDLVTEIWIAPGLRHLPVRFRIHQDAENHVDLQLDRKPHLVAPI